MGMELVHSFTVPADPPRTWELLTDLQQVGGCFPGATVTSADEETFEGEITGVIASGVFARFGDVFEGYLPVRKLPGYFELNELGTALVARRGGRRYRVGDRIEVRVSDIDRPAGKVELAPANAPAASRRSA